MLVPRCPRCKEDVEIDDEDFGHLVECPYCNERFVPEFLDEADEVEEEKYRRMPRSYRPSTGYLIEHKDEIFRRAKLAVGRPAKGLQWTGAIGAVICILGGSALVTLGFVKANDPQAPIYFVYGAMLGGFGSVYHIALAVCGFQMLKLKSKTWGYVGAGLGIASIVIWGICSPTTWAGLTFGIMALTAYSKREVQDALALNKLKDE